MNFLSDWTLEQKVGQLFILAFPGKDVQAIRPLIARYNIGGCYLSQDNAQTFAEAQRLCADLQAMALALPSGMPLLLGVDQEGAWGVLVPASTTGPGNLALGKTGDTAHTQAMYRIFGEEMRYAGFNCVLGPCADVNFSSASPIIDTRAFGEQPAVVAAHVAAAVQGAHAGGIVSCAKHFPGHGHTDADTHREIPSVDKPLERLMQEDLLPFAAAVDNGVDLVMTAHIRYPQLDPEHPATLSPVILGQVLRGRLGFRGIVISDSMNMGAIRRNYTPVEASLQALRAGIDMIMLSEEHYDHSGSYVERQIAMIEAIVQAVRRGDLAQAELDRIVARVVTFKQEKLVPQGRPAAIDFDAHRAVARRAAQAAVAVHSDPKQLLPLPPGQKLVVVRTAAASDYHNLVNVRGIGPNQTQPAFDGFVDELARVWPQAQLRVLDQQQALLEFSAARTVLDGEIVVAVTEGYPLPGEDFGGPGTAQLLALIFSRFAQRTVVVGLRSAYERERWPATAQGATYLSAQSSRDCAARAAALVLAGRPPADNATGP